MYSIGTGKAGLDEKQSLVVITAGIQRLVWPELQLRKSLPIISKINERHKTIGMKLIEIYKRLGSLLLRHTNQALLCIQIKLYIFDLYIRIAYFGA